MTARALENVNNHVSKRTARRAARSYGGLVQALKAGERTKSGIIRVKLKEEKSTPPKS